MPSTDLDARFSLRRGGSLPVEDQRLALMLAIREHGSIAAAARAVGLSYKAAWDGVKALNNLFAQPLVEAQTGGRSGGGTVITPAGEAVIQAFSMIRSELAGFLGTLERRLGDSGAISPLFWSYAMKTSARNALRGTVEKVTDGAVNAEVIISLGQGQHLAATVTRPSVEALELVPGRPVIALIKSSFVILGVGEPGRTSARNVLKGTVVAHDPGAVSSEIDLDIGGGKTITAVITKVSAEELGFEPGEPAYAVIKASHIILAVE
ncbi:LysR family transcriptional regulator [Oleomonas cavernae]|uniref:LysR family transcriptional regulator n=1 Tax=Oleomonas cavernae TaxID=2320859 RepID=A0A418WT37_9PROT|nr:TOBE domain-containing protein [Oleomonas cavernae]RJF94424.1 LysR family transcriptional regulator [Oleomonas cavernae]